MSTPTPAVTGPTVERLLQVATHEVGYHEGQSGGHWNNREKYAAEVPGLEWADGQPWCATFVSWVAMKAGAADLYPRTASCDVAAQWFKDRRAWSEYPAIGAQVFYGTPSDLTHTGFVTAYTATTIGTVEGNTNDDGGREGDGVYAKTRLRRDSWVIGYGYPAFPGGLKSADPNYHRPPPAPTPLPVDVNVGRLPIVRLGARGKYVRIVQGCLRAHHQNLATAGGIDGVFDADLERHVRAFQKANGLNPDGVVGRSTWRLLIGAH